jgi:hypothetical protein
MIEALPSQNCPPPLPGSWCSPKNEKGVMSRARDHLVVRLRPRAHRSKLPCGCCAAACSKAAVDPPKIRHPAR